MILGRVVGQVWATRKHARLGRHKLLIVRPHFWYNPPHEVAHLVAIDACEAGPGDDVVVCLGKPARETAGDAALPVEASVLGVVDRVQLDPRAFGRRPLRALGPPPRGAEAALAGGEFGGGAPRDAAPRDAAPEDGA